MAAGGQFGRQGRPRVGLGSPRAGGMPPPVEQPPARSTPPWARYALGAAVFAVSAAGGAWLAGQAMPKVTEAMGAAVMSRTVDRMTAEAQAKYPHLPPMEAARRHAQEVGPRYLAESKSAVERQKKAAAMFFGFYHANMRSRVEYCEQQGVDISTFTGMFRASQRRSYARAMDVVEAAGMSEERLYQMSRPGLADIIRRDMAAIMQKTFSGPKGACQQIVKQADSLIDHIDFAKVQPEAHRELMGG